MLPNFDMGYKPERSISLDDLSPIATINSQKNNPHFNSMGGYY